MNEFKLKYKEKMALLETALSMIPGNKYNIKESDDPFSHITCGIRNQTTQINTSITKESTTEQKNYLILANLIIFLENVMYDQNITFIAPIE